MPLLIGAPFCGSYGGVFEQGHADTHYDCALDWVAACHGLRICPTSMTLTTRLTRRRAISGCQVTSAKWHPEECFENFAFGSPNVAGASPLPVTRRRLARRGKSTNGTPFAAPSAFHGARRD